MAGIIDFDLRPVFLEDHGSLNPDPLASEVHQGGINLRCSEFCLGRVRDGHAQIVRIAVVLFGIKENFQAAGATLLRFTGISTVTDSLTRLMASTGESGMAASPVGDSLLRLFTSQQAGPSRLA